MSLPNLKDLLIKEQDGTFHESRWNLFKWLIDLDDEVILDIRKSKSKYTRIVRFTLEILLKASQLSLHCTKPNYNQ